jgi:hypothetical protein
VQVGAGFKGAALGLVFVLYDALWDDDPVPSPRLESALMLDAIGESLQRQSAAEQRKRQAIELMNEIDRKWDNPAERLIAQIDAITRDELRKH